MGREVRYTCDCCGRQDYNEWRSLEHHSLDFKANFEQYAIDESVYNDYGHAQHQGEEEYSYSNQWCLTPDNTFVCHNCASVYAQLYYKYIKDIVWGEVKQIRLRNMSQVEIDKRWESISLYDKLRFLIEQGEVLENE